MSSIINTIWRKASKLDVKMSTTRTTQPVTLAVIGCGQRGKAYTRFALDHPEQCKVVAIAEPRPQTRQTFAKSHSVDSTLIFSSWEDLHAASAETISTIGKRLADAVLVAVQDSMHCQVVLAFAEQGYHVLCEKPMATTLEDCLKMEAAINNAAVIFGMGHVLRYSPYTRELTSIIRSGDLGDLVNVVHIEPVGYYHFAHSYVRGSWSSEAKSSFSLMTKSCHDIDILCHWFTPSTPKRVSSFGSLQHFRKSAKPAAAGGATRCLDCPMETQCEYSAKKIYLERVARGETHWPVSTLVDDVPDIENITAALRNGPYGRCVYESDNDVCDHQVVNLEFDDGRTASFTMVAYTSLICQRQTRMHFTHGEIIGDMNTFTVADFRKGTTKRHYPHSEGGGHGGGDMGLIRAFVEAVRTGKQEAMGSDVGKVMKSHLTVFAAELSRREGRVVDCELFETEVRQKLPNQMQVTGRLGGDPTEKSKTFEYF